MSYKIESGGSVFVEYGRKFSILFTWVLITGPLAIAFIALALSLMTGFYFRSPAMLYITLASLAWTVASMLVAEFYKDRNGPFSLSAPYGHRLAVVRKAVKSLHINERSIHASDLSAAYLNVLPFCGDFKIVTYPNNFLSILNFRPITKNPKVIDLSVRIYVQLLNHPENYIMSRDTQKKTELNFRKYAFDLVCHKIPQEISDKVNPYDPVSIKEFGAFVENELNPQITPLAVQNVTVSLQ